MITQRAWLVGVVGFCFYLIAVVNTLPSFYQALTWLSFGVLASSLGIAFLSLIGLRAAWQVPQAIVIENAGQSEGGPIVDLQIANAGTLNKTGILIEVHLQRLAGDAQAVSNGRLVRRFLMEALPSGNSLQTTLPLTQLSRGRYRVVELKFIGSDVLGLFRTQKRVLPGVTTESVFEMKPSKGSTPFGREAGKETKQKSAGEELIVGPAAFRCQDIAISPLQLARGEGVAAPRFLGQGEDVRGTRPYATGDDLRHVHWKSTARKGQLVVKEFHHTVQEQVLVVWDGQQQRRAEKSRAEKTFGSEAPSTAGFTATEWGLRLTASLCRTFLENRRPCALLRLDAAPHSAGLGSDRQPAFSQYGALTMDQVSETLADAEANRSTGLIEALQPFRFQRQAGEVYFVTASVNHEVTRVVQSWRAEGARVAVALVNGAAFSDAVKTVAEPYCIKQLWSTPFPKLSPVRETATAEDYHAQARALRAAGAHVVVVSPRGNSRDFIVPINAALQALFEKSSGGERFQLLENAAPHISSTAISSATIAASLSS